MAAVVPLSLLGAFLLLDLRGIPANLISMGAIDFGIIVDSAVILVENVFRNCQGSPEARQRMLDHLAEERWGVDPTKPTAGMSGNAWTERLRLILISALEVEGAGLEEAVLALTSAHAQAQAH